MRRVGSEAYVEQKQQQQKDEQAQGPTQKKKKVTAAQLRVQKGECVREVSEKDEEVDETNSQISASCPSEAP